MTRDEIIAKRGDYVLATITFADMLQVVPDDVEFDTEPTEEELQGIAESIGQMKPLFFMAIAAATNQAYVDGRLVQPAAPGFTM